MLFHRDDSIITKKRRNSSELTIPRLFTSLIEKSRKNCERAVLCIFHKKQRIKRGSLTVEAAMVLPLFLIAMLTFISVIDICRTQVEQQAALAKQAKTLGMYAYMAEEYMEEPYIDLYRTYPCKLAVSLIPGYRINLALRGRVHTWTGRNEAECAADRETIAAEMVYVTENQDVYHTNSGCSYLELSVYAVGKDNLSSARNKEGRRYGSCEKCCGTADGVGTYYVSSSGKSYHTSRACSGLIRKVRLVRKTEVGHLACCNRCQGG